MSENSHYNLQLRHQNALNIKKYGSSLEKRGKALQESDNQTVKQCGQLIENYGFWLQEYAQATLLYLEIKTLDGLSGGYGKATQAHVNATSALLQAVTMSKLINTKFIEIIEPEEPKQELLNTNYSNLTQKSNIKDFLSSTKKDNDITRIEERQLRIQEQQTRIEEDQLRIQEDQLRIQEHQLRIQEHQLRIQERETRIEDRKLRIEKRQLRIR